jgi:hypothetical protein
MQNKISDMQKVLTSQNNTINEMKEKMNDMYLMMLKLMQR